MDGITLYYRRSQKPKPNPEFRIETYLKKSCDELMSIMQQFKLEETHCQDVLAQIKARQKEVEPQKQAITQKLEEINKRLSGVQNNPQNINTFLNRLFGSDTYKPEAQSAIASLKIKSDELSREISDLNYINGNRDAVNRVPFFVAIDRAEYSLRQIQTKIALVEKAYYRVAPEEKRKKAQKAKIDNLKAHAAAHTNKSRELASIVKREIRHQIKLYPHCPYCQKPLGDNPHADHIYPIKKGGLSIAKNMVYVCCDCNMKKGERTLREYIKEHHLNRDSIEVILEALGKSF